MADSLIQDACSVESLVGRVADEFLQRQGRGEQPSVEEYVCRYPEAAELLRKVLSSLQILDLASPDGLPSASAEEALPRSLGDFRILREVGRGGMGVVYEAEQTSLARRVALKVLPFAATMDPRHLQRFQNEARAAACLHHANIVPVHGVGSDRGVHYYAMQFIEGQTLAALIAAQRQGPQVSTAQELTQPYIKTPQEQPGPAADTAPRAQDTTTTPPRDAAYFRRAAEWGIQAAEALEHAHGLGIIHRDIKPGNLIIDGQGKLWVTDFGLAQIQTNAAMTLTGDLVGTLRYMSPEQALAKRVSLDHRTDIYSLGATLYELLTLEPVIAGPDRQEILRQLAFEEPRPPQRLNKAIPAELATIVLKAVEKNPNDRYATAQEVADDLRRYLEDKPIRAKRPSIVQRARKWARRHKAAVAIAAILVVLSPIAAAAASLREEWHAKAAVKLIEAEQDKTLSALQLERHTASLFRISLAQRDWQANKVARAEEILDECPVDERKWEWHYLKRLCHAYLHEVQLSDQKKMQSANESIVRGKFSANGQRLATVMNGHAVKIWDGTTGRELFSFDAQNVWAFAFSPDGKRVAISNNEDNVQVQAVTIWNATTGEIIRKFKCPVEGFAMAFTEDSRKLIVITFDEERDYALTLDASTGCELSRVSLFDRRELIGVMPSPNGERVIAAGANNSWKVWDVTAGKEVCSLKVLERLPKPFEAEMVKFTTDAGRVAMGNADGSIQIWDTATGQQLARLYGPNSVRVESLAFATDGQSLAAGFNNGSVSLWDTKTGREVRAFRGPRIVGSGNLSPVSMSFNAHGRSLAVLRTNGVLTVWDATTEQEHRTLVTSIAVSLAFSPDGLLMAAPNFAKDGQPIVGVHDSSTLERVYSFPASPDNSTVSLGLAFSLDGRLLAATSGDETSACVQVWNALSQEQVSILRAKKYVSLYEGVAFSPDGQRIAALGLVSRPDFMGSIKHVVQVWDATTSEELVSVGDDEEFGPSTNFASVTFSPDGKRLASVWCGFLKDGKQEGRLKIWDALSGQELFSISGTIDSVAFSPDGRYLAAPCLDGTAKLWDATTGAEVRTIRDASWPLTFSPDGTRLVAGTTGIQDLKVWDTETGHEIITLRIPPGAFHIYCVRFSPDGRYLGVGTDKMVTIFDGAPLKD